MHPVGHKDRTIHLDILWKYPICLIFVAVIMAVVE